MDEAFLFDIMNSIVDSLIPMELEEEIVATVLDGVDNNEAAD